MQIDNSLFLPWKKKSRLSNPGMRQEIAQSRPIREKVRDPEILVNLSRDRGVPKGMIIY